MLDFITIIHFVCPFFVRDKGKLFMHFTLACVLPYLGETNIFLYLDCADPDQSG